MAREDRRLEVAVERGIISEEQATAIRALPLEAREGEAPRGVNAATIAYVVGAITVVVAMGWFLEDRWQWLGPWGVLATCALYAALFVAIARRLGAEGFPTARGFAVTLAVGLVPVATIALTELTGWFDSERIARCYSYEFDFWSCRGEELLAELATALAALVALRRVRFSLLVIPVAGIALRFLFHLSSAIGSDGLGRTADGWVWMFGGSLLAAAAYETDRRQRADEDFARWLHAAAALSALFASGYLMRNDYEYFHHLMVPGALVAFAAALLLRRIAWLALGMTWFIWYLVWLAGEVFKDSPAFPIVLAAVGVGVIILTVWVQRNAARLVARFGTVTSDGRPRFPGGSALLLAPALVAALMFSDGRERDRERLQVMRWQGRRHQMRAAREVRARRDSLSRQPSPSAGGTKRETPSAARP